jgi:hypothetical protein
MVKLFKWIGIKLNELDQRDLWTMKKEWHLLVIWIIGIILMIFIVVSAIIKFPGD